MYASTDIIIIIIMYIQVHTYMLNLFTKYFFYTISGKRVSIVNVRNVYVFIEAQRGRWEFTVIVPYVARGVWGELSIYSDHET